VSDTVTMALSEFLLARLDEDYEVAYGGEPSPWTEGNWDGEFSGPREVLGKFGDVTAVCYYGGTYGHVLRFDPSRIIGGIEANRRVVEEHHEGPTCSDGTYCVTCLASHHPCRTLRFLALPYSDHPDYREEWEL
jgi:hypothetical protein